MTELEIARCHDVEDHHLPDEDEEGNAVSFFTCGEVRARRSMDDIWPFFLSVKICQIQPFRGQRSAGTWVIEVRDEKL